MCMGSVAHCSVLVAVARRVMRHMLLAIVLDRGEWQSECTILYAEEGADYARSCSVLDGFVVHEWLSSSGHIALKHHQRAQVHVS